jgi:hypothetical protein
MHYSPDRRTRVLFINSALLAGTDTWIQLLLLRSLSQGQFELHAAGQPGPPASAFDKLRAIPGKRCGPSQTDSIRAASRRKAARQAANFRCPATHVSLTLMSAIASGLTW